MNLPTHVVAAGGVIFNKEGEVLLVNNPLKGWEYPGGIVEEGETIPQGLMREIMEESGVNVEIINIVGIYSNTKKKKGYNGVEVIPTIVNIDFICRYVSGELRTSEESIEVRWFSTKDAEQIINNKLRYRFEKALKYNTSICCIGFSINSSNEFEINEEYSFERK